MQVAIKVTQAKVSVLTTAHKVHTYIHTYIHGHTFNICMYVCTGVGVHLYVLYAHMHIRTYVCAYAVVKGFDGYMPEYECTCVSCVVCVCMHIHVYVCVCLCVPSTWPCCVVR